MASFAREYEETVRADPQSEERIGEILKEIREIERFDFMAEQEGVYFQELKRRLHT